MQPKYRQNCPHDQGARAIAIVDAFDYPTALADLRIFSTQFGLSAPNLVVKFATSAGACNGSRPANDDIAAVANPNTGVWVCDRNAVHGVGWYIVGGTSIASPLLAGIVNAMGKFRANTAAELTAIYNAKAASPTTAFAIPATVLLRSLCKLHSRIDLEFLCWRRDSKRTFNAIAYWLAP